MTHDGLIPHGIYHDRLFRPGEGERDLGWRNNLVVDRCRHLLAAFVRGEGGVLGVQRLLVGQGSAAWDEGGPPAPTPDLVALEDPAPVVVAVPAAGIRYLDADGNPSLVPTAVIEVIVELAPGVPPVGPDPAYPLREFALFGEIGGAPAMIDLVRHPVLFKGPADTLVRTIRLAF